MRVKQFRQKKTEQIRAIIEIAKVRYAQGKVLFFQWVDFMKSPESDHYYAAAGYFPFIGWLIPLYSREKSPLCQTCAKQGLIMSVTAAGFLFFMFFIELFIPHSAKIISFILIVLTYFFNFGYLALSGYGMYQAVYKKIMRIPVISEQTERLYL
ncbi:MAG: hypothetical protein ACRCUT_10975 [Spirochaetota bacterium]